MSTFSSDCLQAIAKLLRERSWKLAVAESLTGGHVQALVTSISGASDFFVGGITVYEIHQKVSLLHVDRATALACNGVSVKIAEQMARGTIDLFGADCAVATTGYAEPAAAWKVSMPFAFCCVALPRANTIVCRTERFDATGERTAVQRHLAARAIEFLHRVIVTI